ncbi:dihydroneopterin triphosphate diphosphatase [Mannheimia sp. AT1]|uniref:Dihydroneopterin triphosphate diphosphatase n=1 Tax=Mannheimia cairinae TaxID=3025936 RepID=A0ABT5MP51_9PAST|nr:dihydroneopterin triphosphate diphosphatase [Mannheimia cairinae]MDD0823947.1 dihydroneopterin triphosphate diphosphatase [Mannheimia cairinae]MDD0825263.1 dihydroneopterin triphosphate diphosphatase [Mannheimia cairinae]
MNYKNPNSVLVVIYAKDTNRVLMLQRKDDPTFWQSVTGSIEAGEKPIDAAKREIKEETGLQISSQKQPLVDCNQQIEFEIFPHFRYKYAPNTTHCIEHWFLFPLESEQEPILSEHLAYRWVSAEEAINMTKSPNNADAIRQYLLNIK